MEFKSRGSPKRKSDFLATSEISQLVLSFPKKKNITIVLGTITSFTFRNFPFALDEVGCFFQSEFCSHLFFSWEVFKNYDDILSASKYQLIMSEKVYDNGIFHKFRLEFCSEK